MLRDNLNKRSTEGSDKTNLTWTLQVDEHLNFDWILYEHIASWIVDETDRSIRDRRLPKS